MKIETLEMQDTRAKLRITESSPAMVNALRRTMLQDVPKMAIDKVEFHLGPIMENDKEYESVTPLFNEVIAHRLGLTPVPTDYDLFTFQDECVCNGEGCPSCAIMYSLNKVGPGPVMSGDLMPLGNPDLKVKDEFIPIVELTDTQAVLIYATAVMGTAKDHVKWQAAFGVGYSYEPKIEIDETLADDEEVIKASADYPDLFKIEDGRLELDDIECACTFGKALQADPVMNKAVKITWDDTSFIFKYETDGSLTAQQVLDKALEVLAEKARELASQMIDIQPMDNDPDTEFPPVPKPEPVYDEEEEFGYYSEGDAPAEPSEDEQSEDGEAPAEDEE